jgi:hypothetical protein
MLYKAYFYIIEIQFIYTKVYMYCMIKNNFFTMCILVTIFRKTFLQIFKFQFFEKNIVSPFFQK